MNHGVRRGNSDSVQNTIDKTGKLAFVSADGGLFRVNSSRLAAHYASNAQTFAGRFHRLLGVGLMRSIHLIVGIWNPRLATRLMHLPLRGTSRDRLDLLGEEYFQYKLRNHLEPQGVEAIRQLSAAGNQVVLVSRELDHLLRPLAQHLGVRSLVSNRLEFRDGLATGRLHSPIIPDTLQPEPNRAPFASQSFLIDGLPGLSPSALEPHIQTTARQTSSPAPPVVDFHRRRANPENLSVRQALAGKHILLIGGTGFIGKVWLSMLLEDLPEIGRIYLLIRRQGSRSALQRFEKIVAESPAFVPLHERFGDRLPRMLMDRVEVLEGDIGDPGLGLNEAALGRLTQDLDLVVNSAGLTDFNPDIRLAMTTNVDSVMGLIDFLKRCKRAALLHVSTCFVNGRIDGRVSEELLPNYTPAGRVDFDVYRERRLIHQSIERITGEGDSQPVTEEVSARVSARKPNVSDPSRLVRKERTRWIRDRGIEFGVERAQHWGWPNIYTFTKSLGESLLATQDLPFAVVRPSIVESSISQPFRGWNEGVNTTAPLSYLLSTYFRQLPSNKRKRLDVIPVDLVCRGLSLVAAALVQRRHDRVYQLATSATNPADMRRTIELTCLAHRKYYRSLEGLEHWLRARFDTIPVSQARYRNVSLPRLKAVLQGLQRVTGVLPVKNDSLTRKQRALDRVHKVIELYQPFILDNEYFFAADNIRKLGAALPSDEVADFGYHPESIDWYDYWVNLHVPALRRWTYPIIEGRRPDTGLLPRNFKLEPVSTVAATANAPGDPLGGGVYPAGQSQY